VGRRGTSIEHVLVLHRRKSPARFLGCVSVERSSSQSTPINCC
jgi:hypothetical protein